ncbi:MAG: hypothetical protein ABI261_08955 [Ginsengibacter sp.]
MIAYRFIAHTTKLWIAYTKIEDGSNLPDNIEGKMIDWQFSEKVDISNSQKNFSETWLKQIEKEGFCIPNTSIEWGPEKTEKI